MGRGKIEQRGIRRRKVKPVILIITEGSQTEPKYFNHFRTRNNNIDVRVVGSRSSAGETDYSSLLRKAVEYKKMNDLSAKDNDSVWIVADADINYNNLNPIQSKNSQLENVRKTAINKDINIIISNPCFELWYLLHFRYTTRHLNTYKDVYDMLEQHITAYNKNKDIYDLVKEKMCHAIENAKKLEEYQEGLGNNILFGLNVNPFTDVYRLVQVLVKDC